MGREWWEEYGCGCVSAKTTSERRLLGYCPKHGNNRRSLYKGMVPMDDETRRKHREVFATLEAGEKQP